MKVLLLALAALPLLTWGQNDDLFNYRETVGNDYGPRDNISSSSTVWMA